MADLKVSLVVLDLVILTVSLLGSYVVINYISSLYNKLRTQALWGMTKNLLTIACNITLNEKTVGNYVFEPYTSTKYLQIWKEVLLGIELVGAGSF